MNMTTDDTVHAAPARLAGQCGLEVADITHCALDLEFQVLRQAPVGQPQAGAGAVEPAIELERELVGRVAEVGQPACALHDAVEQVAVHDPQPPSVGGDVDDIVVHLDAAEGVVGIAAHELVVVAGHEDHPRALARLAQDLLRHVVVRLRPEPTAPELPAVDDVAHQVQRVAFEAAQEGEQCGSLAARRAQVQIRDPDGAKAQLALGIVHGPEGCGFGGMHGLPSCRPRMTTRRHSHDGAMTPGCHDRVFSADQHARARSPADDPTAPDAAPLADARRLSPPDRRPVSFRAR